MVKPNKNKGFTLAELLIVVAVIAVLVAVAIPTFAGQLEKSRQAVDVSNLRGAFAAAKLVAMDGKFGGADLTTDIELWYDANSGNLYAKADAEGAIKQTINSVDYYGYNKGSSNVAVVADVSNLNSVIGFYLDGTTVKRDKTVTAAQDQAAIAVKFSQDSTTGAWDVASVCFVPCSASTGYKAA